MFLEDTAAMQSGLLTFLLFVVLKMAFVSGGETKPQSGFDLCFSARHDDVFMYFLFNSTILSNFNTSWC